MYVSSASKKTCNLYNMHRYKHTGMYNALKNCTRPAAWRPPPSSPPQQLNCQHGQGRHKGKAVTVLGSS